MVKWESHNQLKTPVKAKQYQLNPGVLDPFGNQIAHPSRIWVDDTLITDVGVSHMKMALAAVIESICVVMCQSNLSLRQWSLAMDIWSNLVVTEHHLALSLVIDSKNMVIKMTKDYLADTLDLIKSTLPSGDYIQTNNFGRLESCANYNANTLPVNN